MARFMRTNHVNAGFENLLVTLQGILRFGHLDKKFRDEILRKEFVKIKPETRKVRLNRSIFY